VTELKELGVITEYDTVICPVTEHSAIRWCVTGNLPTQPEKKPNPKKEVLNKIMDLEIQLPSPYKEKLQEIYKDLKKYSF
jgi:hypothetical protein